MAFKLFFVLLTLSQWTLGNTKIHPQKDVAHNSIPKLVNSRIIFDVTNVESKTDFHTSSPMYYLANDNVSNDICWIEDDNGKPDNIPCGMWFGITGLSVLFNPTQISEIHNFQVNHMTNETILNILNSRKGNISSLFLTVKASTRKSNGNIICYCDHTSNELYDYLRNKLGVIGTERRLVSSVKLGLEYGEDELTCCENDGFVILQHIDYVVLRIEVPLKTTLLSYGIFIANFKTLLEKNRIFTRDWNTNITLYVRLSIQRPTDMVDEIYYRYLAVVYNYLEFWSKRNNETEIIIMNTFPQDLHMPDNFQFMKEKVSPLLFDLDRSPSQRESGCQFACESQGFVKSISSVFENFSYNNPSWKTVCSIWTRCSSGSSISAGKYLITRIPRISIVVNSNTALTNRNLEVIQTLATNAKALNIREMYFNHKLGAVHATHFKDIINPLVSKGINIGCFLEMASTESVSIVNMCGLLFNISSYIVFSLEIKENLESEIPLFLNNFDKTQTLFKAKFPDKHLIPSVILSEPPKSSTRGDLPQNIASSFGEIAHTVYCDPYLKRMNNYYDSILTFANIHKWERILLRPVLENDFTTGWWRSVSTDENINRLITDYPVLVRSNAEDSASDEKFPMTFPCIKWSNAVNSSGINFLQNEYSGVTLDMALRKSPLLLSELEIMMLFILGKFSTVEIVAWNEEDFTNAKKVLSPMIINLVLNDRQIEGINTTIVYISADMTDEILYQLDENFPKNLIAVTLINWEKYLPDKQNSTEILNVNKLVSNNIKYGLLVDDCTYEMNLKLVQINSLPFIQSVSYVVCQVDRIGLNWRSVEENTMTKYLDTLLYAKSYMEKFLEAENVEVMFRISFVAEQPCKNQSNDVEILLKFLYDVNEYSKIYGIRFFVFSAFGKSWYPQNCINSWWRLEDYVDLTNVSNYVEWENDYFHRPTKPGLEHPYFKWPVKDTNETSKGNIVAIIIIVSAMSAVFLVTVIAMWLSLRRMRERYLSEKEYNEFHNGKEMDDETPDHGETKWLRMKFPKNQEIPKRNILLGREIGSGEFGVVYHGILLGQLEVAVKVPQPGSRKEKFKSALAEVKILSYLGNHLNVVLFIGACTKQIVRGKLYIVTEFCKNGSLQSFLRKQQSQEDNVDLYQLCRFSQEIASGMVYIAGKHVIHGDLSTRNVFLTEDFVCKIGDFGLSRRLYELEEYVKESKEPLPWGWMAPESLRNKVFTTKSDIWSYGVTVWEIFSLGSVPYPGKSLTLDFLKELEGGMRMGMPKFATSEIYDMILGCWDLIPEERLSFEGLLNFFSSLRGSVYTIL